ncbi:hypothetical protein DFH08DRAFT_815168 [Mycena albidolilacea]|uniref:Mitochondrial splicing suppressor 51-like C-terminal domain-containing protein n=1 Tax=Mycena albidolilacea TaxID=1033008 RepID=A0AAD6ZPZ9_9AGAR|nr:hypothetical protein DFH08DRAFT_815168 [Mycena albidolilacea]
MCLATTACLKFCLRLHQALALSQTVTLKTCSECTQLGRQHIQEHVTECVLLHLNVFHTIIAESIRGSQFQKLDLCIAFNSGVSVVSTHTWLPTLKLLVEGKIPTVFTSFNREEAEGEAALFHAAGAKLHPALGPTRNLGGSMTLGARTETCNSCMRYMHVHCNSRSTKQKSYIRVLVEYCIFTVLESPHLRLPLTLVCAKTELLII